MKSIKNSLKNVPYINIESFNGIKIKKINLYHELSVGGIN